MEEDTIRVLRIVEYIGPRSWVEQAIANSIHGTKILHNGHARISAATIGLYPEIMTRDVKISPDTQNASEPVKRVYVIAVPLHNQNLGMIAGPCSSIEELEAMDLPEPPPNAVIADVTNLSPGQPATVERVWDEYIHKWINPHISPPDQAPANSNGNLPPST